jgi:thiol-disulfide isomerase/thioredoxin
MLKLNKSLLRYLLLLIVGVGPVAAAQDSAFEFDWQPPAFSAKTAQATTFEYPGDLQGPTIVLFWATWCPYCKALMPHLQSIVDEYGDGVRVLALNFREDGDPVSYIEKAGYQFMLFPEADAVAEAWGIKGTPGLFLADRNGRILFSRGAIPKEAYPAKRFDNIDDLKRSQKAGRAAPFWAARLRESLDKLNARSD